MFIRQATDYEAKQLLHWSVALTEELSMGYMKRDAEKTYGMVSKVLTSGGAYILAQKQDQIIGWILVGVEHNYYRNETVGFIYELYVFPHYRNLGVGKKLMKHSLSLLKNSGFEKVQLNVFAGNPAIEMYKKLGFNNVTSLMERQL